MKVHTEKCSACNGKGEIIAPDSADTVFRMYWQNYLINKIEKWKNISFGAGYTYQWNNIE